MGLRLAIARKGMMVVANVMLGVAPFVAPHSASKPNQRLVPLPSRYQRTPCAGACECVEVRCGAWSWRLDPFITCLPARPPPLCTPQSSHSSQRVFQEHFAQAPHIHTTEPRYRLTPTCPHSFSSTLIRQALKACGFAKIWGPQEEESSPPQVAAGRGTPAVDDGPASWYCSW